MANLNSSVHPVQALRESAIGLEAAVLECLAKPTKEAVHTVRITTRRTEAQLALLTLLPGLPPHQREARKAARVLKKVRRAAGEVRDLDVQRDLIEREAGGSTSGSMRKQAKRLRRELKRRRDGEVERLRTLLHKLHEKLPQGLALLLQTLEPAAAIEVSEQRLIELVRNWYRERAALLKAGAKGGEPDLLHGLRKVAKLARYLAENAPQSAVGARRLAQRLERLQDAGGHWHDWMILNKVAARELGDTALLPQRFAARADSALNQFQRRLSARL